MGKRVLLLILIFSIGFTAMANIKISCTAITLKKDRKRKEPYYELVCSSSEKPNEALSFLWFDFYRVYFNKESKFSYLFKMYHVVPQKTLDNMALFNASQQIGLPLRFATEENREKIFKELAEKSQGYSFGEVMEERIKSGIEKALSNRYIKYHGGKIPFDSVETNSTGLTATFDITQDTYRAFKRELFSDNPEFTYRRINHERELGFSKVEIQALRELVNRELE